MTKVSALINFLILVGVIFWNYIANAQGINDNSVGSLSAEYANLFTPAGYAFSIWAFIYLGLIANGLYQLTSAFKTKKDSFIYSLGPWLILANIGNAAWIWLWLTEKTGLSVLVMIVIIFALFKLVLNLHIGIKKETKAVRTWVWFPISLYAGWITVATVANISAYLAKIGWQGPFTESTWTLVMLAAATAIYVIVLFKRQMITFTAVGIWAITAIMFRHWDTEVTIQWFALACAALLFAGVLYQSVATRPVAKSPSSI